MNHRWASNTWVKISRALLIWQSHAHKPAASLPLCGAFHCKSHAQQPVFHKECYLSWRHIHHLRAKGRKVGFFKGNQVRHRLGLHTSTLYLNTSASKWSAGLSRHMSRVRNTLDTVSKAVSGTHTELMSKISRLKPNALKADKNAEASVETRPKPDENTVRSTYNPSNAALSLASTAQKSVVQRSSANPSLSTSTQETVTAIVPTVTEPREKKLRRIAPGVKATRSRRQEELQPSLNDLESKSTMPKQSTDLFHPSTFSVNLGETYTYVANHVNSYFGSSINTQDKKEEHLESSSTYSQDQQTSDLMPVSNKKDPAPPKRGLGQYLSYSAPTVQAFVGNYIAPLVPKFRTGESTSAVLEEKKSEDVSVKQAEVSNEQKAAEEKAKKLLHQREKVGLTAQQYFFHKFFLL